MSRIFLLSLFVVTFAIGCFAQSNQPCKNIKGSEGKYKFVDGYSAIIENRRIFFLKIKLQPKNINKKYLLKVAHRIKEIYCNETIVSAEIWDSSDKRVFDDLTPPPSFSPATKALYNLDRNSGKETIQFVSSDEIVDEVKING